MDGLWFYFAILIITIIILFYANRQKKKHIEELDAKIENLNSDKIKLEKKITVYCNQLQLLKAEHLKIKNELLAHVDEYCKTYPNIKIDNSPISISNRYQKLANLAINEYSKTFADVDKAILSVSNIMADYLTYSIRMEELKMANSPQYHIRERALKVAEIRQQAQKTIQELYELMYKKDYQYSNVIQTSVFEKVEELYNKNLQLIPYMSKIISDIETAEFELYAKSLDYGSSKERKNKVKTIRQLRAEAKAKIENLKWAEYQLTYLLSLYPTLQEVIETEYEDLEISYDEVTEVDPVRNYLSVEEWKSLSTTEKNQLALDRYIESRKKSKWQIGRDYELYIGYLYQNKGYKIDYFGSYMGFEDLGRDLIATKNNSVLIIQCKYWAKEKLIHEKHIMQLYGSLIAYKIENKTENVTGILVTNIELSETAKKFADTLKIQYIENEPLGSFPRIKCNIGHDEYGETYIYHLPMDFQYDKTKIEKKGEMMAMTVAEAEAAGFRRAFKWHGNS